MASGSDPMVVDCATYADGCRAAGVDIDHLREALQAEPGHFVWVGLHEPSAELLTKVQRQLGLHDLAVEDALRAHQRPKLEEYGYCLFVVLRTAQLENGAVAFGETHLFVGARYLVSVRHGASLSYAAVRQRCESTPALLKNGPGFVLYALMDFVVDHYFPIVDELEDVLERLEEEVFQETYDRGTAQRIYAFKRDLVTLKRAVAPLMEVCNRLVRFDTVLVPEDVRVYFRDVYDHVVRINETVDSMRELLTTALEANLSLVSVAQNEVTKKLAAWAAILGVPTAIAGIYGMNFEDMPEIHWRHGYAIVWSVMLASCTFLYTRFKRSGWL